MKDLTLKLIINAVIDNARAGLAATQNHVNNVKDRVNQLIVRVDAATAQFIVFASIAISTMGQASAAAIALGGHVLSLTATLFRLAQSYLGLSVHVDTHSTKLKAANFLLENFHKEIRLSLGFLGTFADYLNKINFPIPKLAQFIDGLSKAEIVLGIGRGKEKNLFDYLPESIDAARNGVRRFQEAFKSAKEDIQRDLKRFGAAAMAEVVVEWRGVKFESAFADVKKTVSATVDSIKRLRGELLDVAANIALPTDGLAKMQAIAGQMGFPVNEISDFVKLTAKGAVAFELLPEQASESFGTLKNIYNLGLKELEYFGDQINYIADKAGGKVSESALLNVLTRAGGVAQRFGLLRGETVALGAAMLAMGKPPEIVGTAMDNLLSKLQNAPNQTKDFQIGLQQLGFDAVKLADDIEKNPKKSLDEFLVTLSKLDARSQSDILTKIIGDAGETKGVIGDLIGNLAEYNRLSALANAGDISGSMNATFIERQKTVEAALIMMKNAWDGVAVSISTMFLPTIRLAAESLRDLAVWLRKVNDEYPNLASFARIALIFGTLGTVMSLAFRALPGLAAGAGTAVATAFRTSLVSGFRAIGSVLTSVVGGLWNTIIGQFVIKMVAGAAIIQIGMSNVVGVIGALTSALVTLVSSPVSLALASFAMIAVRLGVAGGAIARVGIAMSGFGTILMRLVGGPIGLIVSVLAFLIVKYNEVKDETVALGRATTSLSQIISTAWQLLKERLAIAINAAIAVFDDTGKAMVRLVSSSDTSANQMESRWARFFSQNTLLTGAKQLVNSILGLFSGVGNAIGVGFATVVETVEMKLRHLSSLMEAAGKDWKAARNRFDFSGSNIKAQVQANGAENTAQKGKNQYALPDALIGGYNGDHIQQFLDEIEKRELAKQQGLTLPPTEKRQGGGVGLSGSGDPSADIEKQQKATKAVLDVQLNAIKNRQDALKAAHDLDLHRLDNGLKAHELGLKTQLAAEEISEQDFRDKSLAAGREKSSKELEIKKQFYIESAQLAVAEAKLKNKAAMLGGEKFKIDNPKDAAEFEKIGQENNGDLAKAQSIFQARHGGGKDLQKQDAIDQLAIEKDLQAKLEGLKLEAQAKDIEFSTTQLENTQATTEQQKALANELLQARKDSALADLDFKRQMADQELELGEITQEQHLQRLKELAAEELALRLKLLEDERKLHPNDPVAQAKISGEQQQLMLKFNADFSAMDFSGLKNSIETIKGLFAPLENAVNQSVNGILTNQQTIANAAKNTGSSMLLSYASTFAKERAMQAAQWAWKLAGIKATGATEKALKNGDVIYAILLAAREKAILAGQWAWEAAGEQRLSLRKRAIKLASTLWDRAQWAKDKIFTAAQWVWELMGFGAKEAAKTTTKVASETVQTTAQVTNDVVRTTSTVAANEVAQASTASKAKSSIFAMAAEAAVSAYNAMASIPYIGPVLGAVAAVATFAAMMAYGAMIPSSKKGLWSVPEDRVQMVHEQETILPAGVADNFRSVVNFVKTNGLQSTDVSAVVNDLVPSGQLHGNWTIPASVSGIAQQSSEQATKMAQAARRNDQAATAEKLAAMQPVNHNTYKTIKEGDNHFNVSAVDGQSVKRLLESNGDTIARVVRNKTKSGKSLKS